MIEVMIQTFSRAVVPSSDVKGVAVLLFQFLWKGREGKAHHIGSSAGGGMTEETYISVVKLPIRSCSEDESQKGSHQQLRSFTGLASLDNVKSSGISPARPFPLFC